MADSVSAMNTSKLLFRLMFRVTEKKRPTQFDSESTFDEGDRKSSHLLALTIWDALARSTGKVWPYINCYNRLVRRRRILTMPCLPFLKTCRTHVTCDRRSQNGALRRKRNRPLPPCAKRARRRTTKFSGLSAERLESPSATRNRTVSFRPAVPDTVYAPLGHLRRKEYGNGKRRVRPGCEGGSRVECRA